MITVTAHTGCMNTKANTIESIEAGFSAGADIVEVDIRFDSEGIPVLSHDSIDKSKEYVTLSQAFDYMKNFPDKKMNLDIKSTENMPEIQRLAKEKGVIEQVFFTGITEKFINAAKTGCPEITYYLNLGGKNILTKVPFYINYLVKKTKQLGATGINLSKFNCSKMLIDIFHKNDLSVSVWTITDKKTAKKYIEMLPDNITCKNPDEVLENINCLIKTK